MKEPEDVAFGFVPARDGFRGGTEVDAAALLFQELGRFLGKAYLALEARANDDPLRPFPVQVA